MSTLRLEMVLDNSLEPNTGEVEGGIIRLPSAVYYAMVSELDEVNKTHDANAAELERTL